MKSTTQSRRIYLPMRGFASAASLLLAFWYSRELGVLNRSFLAVIMTTSILCSVAYSSGSTFTLRSLKLNKISAELKKSFATLVVFQGAAAFVTFSIALFIFSEFKDQLPSQLIFVSMGYFLFSYLHLILMEILLAEDRFKKAGLLEVFTICIQIFTFLGFSFFNTISIATRVLLSLMISYFIISIYVLYKINLRQFFGFVHPRHFWALTRGKNSLGTVLGILDRADRIIIAWVLPTINTGQYAVMGSILSFFRFAPDALSKIIVSRKSGFLRTLISKKLFVAFTSLLALVLLTVFSQFVIRSFLGSDWLLPWWISITFGAQEIARGAFQVAQNQRLALLVTDHRANLPIYLLGVNLTLALILSSFLGLIGVPLGFLIGYCFSLLLIVKDHNNA